MVTRGKDRKVRKGGFKKARKGREQGRREGEVGEPGKEVNLWAAPKAHSLWPLPNRAQAASEKNVIRHRPHSALNWELVPDHFWPETAQGGSLVLDTVMRWARDLDNGGNQPRPPAERWDYT